MEPSDEMVESFAREYYGNALVARDAQIKSAIENALRAALAVMLDQHRAGWLAGRDAALEIAREQVTICDADIDEGDLLSQFYREGASRCCDAIRDTEPPA